MQRLLIVEHSGGEESFGPAGVRAFFYW